MRERCWRPFFPGFPKRCCSGTLYLQGEGSVRSFRRDSSELAVTVQSRLRVTAAEGVRAAVLADVGLTIASEWMFSSELRSGAVRAVLLDGAFRPSTCGPWFPAGTAPPPRYRRSRISSNVPSTHGREGRPTLRP